MKAVIIDDNQQFSKLLCDQLSIIKGDSNAQPCEKKPLKFKEEKKPENGKTEIVNAVIDFAKHESRLIAQVIVEIYGLKNGNCEGKKDQLHIFINIEGKFGGASRQEQKGVEILMWLRCKHRVCNPVILYSFQSNAELLKKKPEHLIINSEGCYSYQLPLEIEKIKQRIEVRSFRGVSNWEGLKKFLKPAFDIEKFRHREANWWGVKCLWDVHTLIAQKKKEDFPYPSKVQESLNEVNSKVGEFIHETSENKIEAALRCNISRKISNEDKTYHKWINENRKLLNQRSIKILHIDDQWADGWGEIFSKIIYLNSKPIPTDKIPQSYKFNDFFRSIKPSECSVEQLEENFKNSVKQIKEKNFDYDLVLLDLRLLERDNQRDNEDVANLSGAIFLRLFREDFKGVPVLMTTASNKIWSYEELMKLGADAYWMKEGIDNYFSTEESLINYCKFLNLVEKMTSESYAILKEIDSTIEYLEQEENQWWVESKSNKWKNCEAIDANNNEILKLLKSSIVLTKTYLHQFYLGYGFSSDIYNGFYLSSMINKLGTLAEIIHDIKEEDYTNRLNIVQLMKQRGDLVGLDLRDKRNTASHRDYRTISLNYFIDFWQDIKAYLENRPQQPRCTETTDTTDIKKLLSARRDDDLSMPPNDLNSILKTELIGKASGYLTVTDRTGQQISIAAFIPLYKNITGFLHCSNSKKLNNNVYVEDIGQIIKIGDKIKVRVIEVDLSTPNKPKISLEAIEIVETNADNENE